MLILGEFPGFVRDSFSFDFPGSKGKISQNVKLVYITEYFIHSFAPIDLEILRSLLHGVVLVWHYEAGSISVFLLCCVEALDYRNLYKICLIFLQGHLPLQWGRA